VAAEEFTTPAEVDAIFKDVLKTSKGPFEQMDVVGLDVVLDIEEHYAETRSGLPGKPRELLRSMIKDGKLGLKNGRDFYDYLEGMNRWPFVSWKQYSSMINIQTAL
jgi:3-hydroxyacyl-CoA dehydrogenase